MGAYSVKMSKVEMERHLEETVRHFSKIKGTGKTKSRFHVRRRTADAGHCKRAYVRPTAFDAG